MAEIVDARLLVVSGQLHMLGSIPATAYRAQLAPLHLSLGRSSGLHSDAPAELFATSRRTEATFLRHGRCAGRSQSFFEWNDTNSARGRKTGPSVRLMFQAWLAPAVTCELSRAPRKSLRPASVAERPNSDQPVFVGTGLRNVARGSCLAQRHPTTLQRGRNGAATCKLSLNGVSVRLSDGRLLGIGHLHRGFRDTLDGSNLSKTLTYFAHHYTHFFYAQEAAPPFVISMVGSSASSRVELVRSLEYSVAEMRTHMSQANSGLKTLKLSVKETADALGSHRAQTRRALDELEKRSDVLAKAAGIFSDALKIPNPVSGMGSSLSQLGGALSSRRSSFSVFSNQAET